MSAIKDLTGKRFGKLTVIKRSNNDYISPKGNIKVKWVCICDCGNECEVMGSFLTRPKKPQLSCGCYRLEKIKETEGKTKIYNKYDLTGEYGIGYTQNNEKFIFDLDDYELIKDYCWNIHHGYVSSNAGDKNKLMHRLITCCPEGMVVDHINRNRSDNRRSNLRICTINENGKNQSKRSCNKSGIIGVYFNKKLQKWVATIKKKHIGVYENIEDATLARLIAESNEYGEFSPQVHLFKEYNINY